MSTEAKPYGFCRDCDVKFATEEDSRRHQDETLAASVAEGNDGHGRSHATRILTPSRERMVRSMVEFEIEDAMMRWVEEMDRRIHAGDFTEEEATEALRSYPDFADYWDEWVAEGQD